MHDQARKASSKTTHPTPERAAEEVIGHHDGRADDQDLPVAVEGQEGERAEDVEMGLDSPAGQVDQQRADEHLGDGHDVACRGGGAPE
jgi:hypothetical protein